MYARDPPDRPKNSGGVREPAVWVGVARHPDPEAVAQLTRENERQPLIRDAHEPRRPTREELSVPIDRVTGAIIERQPQADLGRRHVVDLDVRTVSDDARDGPLAVGPVFRDHREMDLQETDAQLDRDPTDRDRNCERKHHQNSTPFFRTLLTSAYLFACHLLTRARLQYLLAFLHVNRRPQFVPFLSTRLSSATQDLVV